MEKVAVFTYERERVTLSCGTRAVLVLESELPVCECAAAHHTREMAKRLFAHAEREYFPVAERELEDLVAAGRGFAFARHRLCFTARLLPMDAGLCMKLSLRYTVGSEVRAQQAVQSFWTADGAHRCRRVKKQKKSTNNCCK